MAGGGLSAVRDALVTANAYNLIDDDAFVLLYDAYSSKAIFRTGNSQNLTQKRGAMMSVTPN